KLEKAILNQIYEFNTTETAILFIKKGRDLLHQHGYQSYIIPKSYTFASNYERIRQFTVNNLISLVDCGKVWPDVKLEVCIFTLTKILETLTYSSHQITAANCEVIFRGYLDKELVKIFNFLPHGLSTEEI
ncbi:MAG: Eco57I restriction-modification methylase domain-containing protein, partial [Dolichospermum sp.]